MARESDIETIQADKPALMRIANLLDLELVCHYCKEELTEDNVGGIMSEKIMLCDNIICMAEYYEDREDGGVSK